MLIKCVSGMTIITVAGPRALNRRIRRTHNAINISIRLMNANGFYTSARRVLMIIIIIVPFRESTLLNLLKSD